MGVKAKAKEEGEKPRHKGTGENGQPEHGVAVGSAGARHQGDAARSDDAGPHDEGGSDSFQSNGHDRYLLAVLSGTQCTVHRKERRLLVAEEEYPCCKWWVLIGVSIPCR